MENGYLPKNSSFHKLSDDLWTNIFKELNLRDRANVRASCKRFKKVCDKIKVDKMVICNGKRPGENNSWFLSSELVQQCDTIHLIDYGFKFMLPGLIRSTLKRIKFDEADINFFYLKKLEQQTKFLEQLEFGSIKGNKVKLTLKLPCLRKLYIGNMGATGVNLRFDCPNLVACYFGEGVGQSIVLINPKSIQHFEFYDSIGKNALMQFQNAEVIHTNKITKLPFGELIALTELPKLRNLHFEIGCTNGTDKPPLAGELARLSSYIEYLIQHRRSGLKLYVRGVRITGDKTFNDYRFDTDILTLHDRNRHRLASSFPLMTSLNYNDLNDLYGNTIPKALFDRYPNLATVSVFQKVNSKHLSSFLSECRKLTSLELIETELNQDFYNELSRWKIMELEVIEKVVPINFEFLAKLECLHTIKTNLNFRPKLVLRLLRSSTSCTTQLAIRIFDYNLLINKLAKNVFNLKYMKPTEFSKEAISYEELFKLVHQISKNGLSEMASQGDDSKIGDWEDSCLKSPKLDVTSSAKWESTYNFFT